MHREVQTHEDSMAKTGGDRKYLSKQITGRLAQPVSQTLQKANFLNVF